MNRLDKGTYIKEMIPTKQNVGYIITYLCKQCGTRHKRAKDAKKCHLLGA